MKKQSARVNLKQAAGRPDRSPPKIQDFKCIKHLGSGGFGDVWLVQNTAKHPLALKTVKGTARDYSFKKELNALTTYQPVAAKHRGLLQIYHVGWTVDKDTLYYTMPLADHIGEEKISDLKGFKQRYKAKTLGAVLKQQRRISIPTAIKWTCSILDALECLHSSCLVHRDIKPDNIIFCHGEPILADIGLITTPRPDGTIVGTAGYMPPNGCNSHSGDLYAIGKMLYVMISGNDVEDYPNVPSLVAFCDNDLFSKVNKIISTACELRYTSAKSMADDLSALLPRKDVAPIIGDKSHISTGEISCFASNETDESHVYNNDPDPINNPPSSAEIRGPDIGNMAPSITVSIGKIISGIALAPLKAVKMIIFGNPPAQATKGD